MTRKDAYRETLARFSRRQDRYPRRHADDRQRTPLSQMSLWSESSTPTSRCTCRTSAPASGPSSCSPRSPAAPAAAKRRAKSSSRLTRPFSPSIQFARHHDFAGYFEQELEFRERCDFPPVQPRRAYHRPLRARSARQLFRRDLSRRLKGKVCLTSISSAIPRPRPGEAAGPIIASTFSSAAKPSSDLAGSSARPSTSSPSPKTSPSRSTSILISSCKPPDAAPATRRIADKTSPNAEKLRGAAPELPENAPEPAGETYGSRREPYEWRREAYACRGEAYASRWTAYTERLERHESAPVSYETPRKRHETARALPPLAGNPCQTPRDSYDTPSDLHASIAIHGNRAPIYPKRPPFHANRREKHTLPRAMHMRSAPRNAPSAEQSLRAGEQVHLRRLDL